MEREKLAKLVEKSIPRFSGVKKVFLITLQLGQSVVKVVFWRPNNYTMVAHNHQAPVEAGCETFHITAFHDSCWRYDGLAFLNRFSFEDQKNVQIISSELLDSQNCSMNASETIFKILKD